MNDPFDTLGVAPRFALDLPALELRHRDLSRALHPDRFAGAPAAERRMSLGRAIDVNEAFRALKDPVRRAEALLRRAGAAVGEISEPRPPASLLMEMMEVREELADAKRGRDLAVVERLATTMREREKSTLARLGRAFDGDAGPPALAPAAPQEILPLLGELRYIRRFLDEVSAIEEELSP
jgi:molecular chaperone HscB